MTVRNEGKLSSPAAALSINDTAAANNRLLTNQSFANAIKSLLPQGQTQYVYSEQVQEPAGIHLLCVEVAGASETNLDNNRACKAFNVGGAGATLASPAQSGLPLASKAAFHNPTLSNNSSSLPSTNQTRGATSAYSLDQSQTQSANSPKDPSKSPLSLGFELNQGQAAPQVKYLAHGQGYNLFLTADKAVLDFGDASANNPATCTKPASSSQGAKKIQDPCFIKPNSALATTTPTRTALYLQLVGANPNAEITAQQKLGTSVNYLKGKDASKWHTNIPSFGRVEYSAVYPGIDLTYYGQGGQLEYDFALAPKADPSQITLQFEGAKGVTLDSQGQLVIDLPGGKLRQAAPLIYQEINGSQKYIAGGYVKKGPDKFGFKLTGAYDTNLPLVIDPLLSLGYATYLGGGDSGTGIAVDSAGNTFVTGISGAGFPTIPGSYQTNAAGNSEVFVSKLNSDGTALIYSTFLGGSNADFASGIAIDSAGNAYVAGYTYSADFPVISGTVQPTFSGGISDTDHGMFPSDAFVAKLSPAGNQLLYSTYLGGSGNDYAHQIVIDNSGNAYLAGATTSANFPTHGAYQTDFGGGDSDPANGIYPYDAFVAKLNPTATALTFSTYLGGSGTDSATGLALDGSGNVYVTGNTNGAGESSTIPFPTTGSAFQSIYTGGSSTIFVTKFDPNGASLLYSTFLGGGAELGGSIAVDSSGNAFVTGAADGNIPIIPGAAQPHYGGGPFDAFVTKLNPSGSVLLYSTFVGSNGDDRGSSIALDAAGDAYISGFTNSGPFLETVPFPTTPGAYRATLSSQDGGFLTKLDPAGATLLYSTIVNSSFYGTAAAVAVDSNTNAYVTGYGADDLVTTPGVFSSTIASIFVLKVPFDRLAFTSQPAIMSWAVNSPASQ